MDCCRLHRCTGPLGLSTSLQLAITAYQSYIIMAHNVNDIVDDLKCKGYVLDWNVYTSDVTDVGVVARIR